MTFWESINGVVEVEMTAAEPEKALTAITMTGIKLSDICHDRDLTCSFEIRRQDCAKLTALCRRYGHSLKIVRKRGIYYTLANLRRRKLLLFGIGMLLFSAFFLPTRILFVRVEGNTSIPAKRIISAAEETGIHFGAPRRQIRSEKVKNALLDAIPQLQWAGVNTSGCTAVISVRERQINRSSPQSGEVSSIIADRDGYILSCVVTQGSARVQPGQAVRKGQTLISGYTECGISIQATQAKGEVLARTIRNLTVLSPTRCLKRADHTGTAHTVSLLLGKKRIFFWKGSGIPDAGCGRMYKQYSFTLPGGFRLPVALCVDTFQSYALEDGESEPSALGAFAHRYLTDQMVAGQIQSSAQSVLRSGGVVRLNGSYVCTESIGKVKPEQIGETNGKTNGENR